MSSGDAFGTARNILSNWPAGVHYSPSADKYLYSVSSTWQISALDHLHVIAIDVPQTPPGVNTMTLTLPVMVNLPLQSRIYFFYVSQSNNNDILVFQPVVGSGDTINGNASNYSFVLTGVPQLYIAIGVNDNYIVHAFGRNANTVATIPTEYFSYNSAIAPVNGIVSPYSTPNPSSTEMVAGLAAAAGPTEVVPGMQGFLTANFAVPTTSFQGFKCNQSGVYLVNPDINASLTVTPTNGVAASSNLGTYQGNLIEYNADGSFSSVISLPASTPFRESSNLFTTQFPALFFVSSASNVAYSSVTEGTNIGAIYLDVTQASSSVIISPGYSISTAFTPTASIPTLLQPGYLCNVTGSYRITWNIFGNFLYNAVGTSSGAFTMGYRIVNASGTILYTAQAGAFNPNGYALATPNVRYNSTGALIRGVNAGQYVSFYVTYGTPAVGTGIVAGQNTWSLNVQFELISNAPTSATQLMPWHANTSFFAPLRAGKIYVPSLSWDNSSTAAVNASSWQGAISFCYWSANLPSSFSGLSPPAPMMMSLDESIAASNTDPEFFAPMHAALPKEKVKEIQKKASQSQQLALMASSSSSSPATPSFTLADIEQIVSRAVAAERGRSAVPDAPPHRKRARISEGEKEPA